MGRTTIFIDISITLFGILCFLFFFTNWVRTSNYWLATVAPLASIIGSGFLVVAPLLWMLTGYASFWTILCVVIAAYAIGSVIRFNIQYVEPLLSTETTNETFKLLDDASYILLSVSYFISIAFYIRILSAFALRWLGIEDAFLANLLTTVILLSIGLVGYFRGIDRLEALTEYSVNIKLTIIMMFLLGLFLYDWLSIDFQYATPSKEVEFTWTTVRKIFGILLIVQGFEISRYIGNKFPADLRIKTMKWAQIISSLIYLVFIFLIMFLMGLNQKITETEIVGISSHVSLLLPLAITIGAIFSQFSAAIADTIGCGGIINEYSQNRVSHNTAYIIIVMLSIILIWTFNIFEIISFASQSFAAYYFSQCVHAIYVNHLYKIKGIWWSFYFAAVGILMLLITIFGLPADA